MTHTAGGGERQTRKDIRNANPNLCTHLSVSSTLGSRSRRLLCGRYHRSQIQIVSPSAPSFHSPFPFPCAFSPSSALRCPLHRQRTTVQTRSENLEVWPHALRRPRVPCRHIFANNATPGLIPILGFSVAYPIIRDLPSSSCHPPALLLFSYPPSYSYACHNHFTPPAISSSFARPTVSDSHSSLIYHNVHTHTLTPDHARLGRWTGGFSVWTSSGSVFRMRQ